ncbi:unnamed protein product, partial [Scytosiphon promiscuus]
MAHVEEQHEKEGAVTVNGGDRDTTTDRGSGCHQSRVSWEVVSPLAKADIVSHLVEFVPPRQFLFFAPVSKIWRKVWARLPPLKESFEYDFPRSNVEVCAAMAGRGNLPLLQFALLNGCVWGDSTLPVAAEAGHLHIVVWARANGCTWGAATFHAAARGGHVYMLRWLKDNECPWNAWTCQSAAICGHLLA